MKKEIILSAAVASFALVAFTGKKSHTDVYKVDPKQSLLEWYAEKVTGKHNGTIMVSSGTLANAHGQFSGAVEIDMTTLANKDIEEAGTRAKLEGHLKSPDFFDVAKYPKAKFVISSITPVKEAKPDGFTHNVKGMLTIKDKTNEISFDAVMKTQEANVVCVGSAVVDRTKYDVRYGSKTFFADIGDKMINDEFTLKFTVVAVK